MRRSISPFLISYIEDHQKLINRFEDGLLLIMLDEHFGLGMNDLLPSYKEKGKDAYMRLYGKYYRNNSSFNFPPDKEEDGGMEDALESFSKTLDTAYYRVIIASFCDKLVIPEELVKFIQERSSRSDTDLIQMYALMAEFDRSKCGVPAGISMDHKNQMAKKLVTKMAEKKFNVNNKVEAIALLQYGRNTNAHDPMFPTYVSIVTASQDKDGYWETQEGKVSEPDMHTTIYGLWALLEMREALTPR
jgi:hypothetical protein